MRRTVAWIVSWVLLSTAHAGDDSSSRWAVPAAERGTLAANIRAALAQHESVSQFPLPPFDEQRLSQLFDGEVVRIREKWDLPSESAESNAEEGSRQRNRVLAYRLVPLPREQVWLGALDPHLLPLDGLTEVRLHESPHGASTWFQYLDLPWPVRDRLWVIRVGPDAGVARATGGRAWEQAWRMESDARMIGLDLASSKRLGGRKLDDVREARALIENAGAWIVLDLGENRTLLAYQLTIVLGGWIPEALAARFAMSTLETLLDNVACAAAEIPKHYDAKHDPILGGDGLHVRSVATPE
jgi:hypothetical protein